jgi:hypothetical protein
MSDSVLIIVILILCLAFCGEPDLHDAALSHVMKENQCEVNNNE